MLVYKPGCSCAQTLVHCLWIDTYYILYGLIELCLIVLEIERRLCESPKNLQQDDDNQVQQLDAMT